MSDETTLTNDLRHLGVTSALFAAMTVVILSLMFIATTWLTVRVTQITHQLRASNDRIAAQQVVLNHQQRVQARQQVALKRTQTEDAASSCASTNAAYASVRFVVRQEAVVQIGQALSLYQRTEATLSVNPPKNAKAIAARRVSDSFLVALAHDTYTRSLASIEATDARTKPLNCAA